MNKKIHDGESKTLEFKSELPKGKKLAQTAIAFANGAGGELLIGVADGGSVVGIGDIDRFKLADQITAMLYDNCSPQISFDIFTRDYDGRLVVVVKVYPGRLKPYYLKSAGRDEGIYIRVGASNRLADQVSILELERQRANISFDEEIEYHAPTVETAFLSEAFQRNHLEFSEEKLLNLGLLRRDGSSLLQTRGLHILAGAYDFVLIQCARFKGNTKAVFLDKKEYSGNLFEQLAMTELFIQNHLRTISEFKGLQRTDHWEIPQSAIREALVNAVVHRDYSNPGRTIKVAIYDDILEIISPGGLPNTLTLEQLRLGGRSEIRNRVLAGVFKRLNYIEQWGSGIERMNTLCREAKLKEPVLTESGEFLSVIFGRPDISVAATDKVKNTTDNATDKVKDATDNEQKILDYLQANESISNRHARALTGLSGDGVLYLLKKLVKSGKIIPAGAKRNRIYRLSTKVEQ